MMTSRRRADCKIRELDRFAIDRRRRRSKMLDCVEACAEMVIRLADAMIRPALVLPVPCPAFGQKVYWTAAFAFEPGQAAADGQSCLGDKLTRTGEKQLSRD